MAPKTQRPALGAGRLRSLQDCVVEILQSGGAFGVFPSDARDVRAADADVGEFTIAKAVQFLNAGTIGAPLTQEPEEVSEKHGRLSL